MSVPATLAEGRRRRRHAFAAWAGVLLLALGLSFTLLSAISAPPRPAAPMADAGMLDAGGWDFAAHGAVPLAGEWEVYWGRLLSPEDLDSTVADGTLAVPGVWNGRRVGNTVVEGKGAATLRLRISLPTRGDEAQGDGLAILMPPVKSAMRLWIDGVPVASAGLVATTETAEVPRLSARLSRLPMASAGSGGPRVVEVVLNVSNHFHFEGGVGRVPEIGRHAAMEQAMAHTRVGAVFLVGALAMVGLYHLVLAFGGGHRAGYLLFGVLSLLFALRAACVADLPTDLFPDVPQRAALALEYVTVFAMLPVYLAFLGWLFPSEVPRRAVVAFGGVAAVACLSLVFPADVFTRLRDPYYLVLGAILAIALLGLARAAWKRRSGAAWLLAASLVMAASVIHDMAIYQRLVATPDLAPLGFLVFALAHALVLGLRAGDAHKAAADMASRLRELNASLEQRVEERTRKLSDEVTRRRRMEGELRKLSQAVEYSPSSVIVTDWRGVIAYANPKFCEVTGYHPEDVVGERPSVLKSGKTPPATYRDLWRTIRDGRVWRGEFINRRRDGGLYWEAAAIAPVRDGAGAITHYVAVKEDITARKKAEAALREAKEVAESEASAKAEMLATMSHEIRTPLGGMVGMLALLSKTRLDAVQRDYVETLRDSGDALNAILNDVLDYSKLEAGRMELEQAAIEPRRLLDGVIALMSSRADERGIALGARVAPEVPARLIGDPTRLRQVLLNLISNAVKFTERGSVDVVVEPFAASDGTRLKVSVIDTGIGMSEEVRIRLFSDYGQADASIARRFGGTGLGLAICRRLVDLMGGEIGADSAPGRGSTFWFTVPLEAAGDAPEVAAQDAVPPSSRPLRVLVAEDNVVNRKVARGLLESLGHAVRTVSDGAAAVEMARRGGFDIVLMDMNMPKLDGLAATRAIRALDGEAGRVAVIAMTANAGERAAQRCFDAGMDGFVTKPVTAAALAHVLDDHTRVQPQTDRDATDPLGTLMAAMGEDWVAEMVADYLDFLGRVLVQLREAASGGDGRVLARLAHDIKSTSGNLGQSAVAEAAATLERSALDGAPAAGLSPAVAALEAAAARAREDLAARVKPARRTG